MTDQNKNKNIPSWAIKSFEFEGKTHYEDKDGYIRFKNGKYVKHDKFPNNENPNNKKKPKQKSRTEDDIRDDKGRFKKGVSGNPAGHSKEIAKTIREVKAKALTLLNDNAFSKLEDALNDPKLNVFALVQIIKILADISLPKETEINTDGVNIPSIVISDKALKDAENIDRKYREEYEQSQHNVYEQDAYH